VVSGWPGSAVACAGERNLADGFGVAILPSKRGDSVLQAHARLSQSNIASSQPTNQIRGWTNGLLRS
jgi:hypothetical protein